MRPIPPSKQRINKGSLRRIQGLLVPRKNYQKYFQVQQKKCLTNLLKERIVLLTEIEREK